MAALQRSVALDFGGVSQIWLLLITLMRIRVGTLGTLIFKNDHF